MRLRHPRRALFVSVARHRPSPAGLIAWFATRTEKGPGPSVAPEGRPGLTDVKLDVGRRQRLRPRGRRGEESPEQARNVIDGNPPTDWDTETYQGGFAGSHKSGVGIYVDTGSRSSRRGSSTLVTRTPGFGRPRSTPSDSVPGEHQRLGRGSAGRER